MDIVRLSGGRLKPGSWDAFEKAYREFAERMAQVPGLKDRSLLKDTTKEDAGWAVTVWESQEAIDAYNRSDLAQEVKPILSPYFINDYVEATTKAVYRLKG